MELDDARNEATGAEREAKLGGEREARDALDELRVLLFQQRLELGQRLEGAVEGGRAPRCLGARRRGRRRGARLRRRPRRLECATVAARRQRQPELAAVV